ncbi:MAG: fibronectin type III domain-containing protein [Nitrospira sp.]|nr:fibronectin type III domain-containing protein [Nitrospira sp.]
MLLFETLVGLACGKPIRSIAYPVVMILLLSSVTGCADENAGGPVASNLSAPTNATGAMESEEASHSTVADVGGEDPMITMTSTSSGITANVSWDQPPGFNVAGYTLYYGKHSQGSESVETTSEESDSEASHSEELSWCSQGESKTVKASSTTITGLEPNTQYFFAIRAFTEVESENLCSNAIMMTTPPAEA